MSYIIIIKLSGAKCAKYYIHHHSFTQSIRVSALAIECWSLTEKSYYSKMKLLHQGNLLFRCLVAGIILVESVVKQTDTHYTITFPMHVC